jgi:hypothetical protein
VSDLWRVGHKIPLNVYDGDRPVCQCHSNEDALLIVRAINDEDSDRDRLDWYSFFLAEGGEPAESNETGMWYWTFDTADNEFEDIRDAIDWIRKKLEESHS